MPVLRSNREKLEFFFERLYVRAFCQIAVLRIIATISVTFKKKLKVNNLPYEERSSEF